MDNLNRRQQQPRSNSISGHDYYMTNIYGQASKHQNDMAQKSYYVDKYQQYSDGGHLLQQINNQRNNRSSSPFNNNGSYVINQNCQPPKPPRNHLHASLECLNMSYTDYNDAQQNSLSYNNPSRNHTGNSRHHQQISQIKPLHNQHYATSYVLTAAPAEAVISSDGHQDLAAAAMGNPPSLSQNNYGSPSQAINYSRNAHLAQSLINRNMVNGSPMRRLNHQTNTNTSSASTNLINHMMAAHQSMRAGHSSLSLASSTFLIEDKLQNEIKKLQSELISEKEKNEALNSQLSINSNLMAAFEQSLNTLNNRLRQITAASDKKDKEIEDLKNELGKFTLTTPTCTNDQGTSPVCDKSHYLSTNSELEITLSPGKSVESTSIDDDRPDGGKKSRQDLIRIVDELKRQLIEKDRLLTDTRLEALSAAHQLEQLESRLNGEHSLLNHEDELDEGVIVVNHSPSDSEAITDSNPIQFNGSGENQFGRPDVDINNSEFPKNDNASSMYNPDNFDDTMNNGFNSGASNTYSDDISDSNDRNTSHYSNDFGESRLSSNEHQSGDGNGSEMSSNFADKQSE